MDFDALFAMPNSMPGYYDIEDRLYAGDGRLFITFIFVKLSLNGEDEDAPSHSANTNVFGNCMKYLSSIMTI
jgi:hypothetical protein